MSFLKSKGSKTLKFFALALLFLPHYLNAQESASENKSETPTRQTLKLTLSGPFLYKDYQSLKAFIQQTGSISGYQLETMAPGLIRTSMVAEEDVSVIIEKMSTLYLGKYAFQEKHPNKTTTEIVVSKK